MGARRSALLATGVIAGAALLAAIGIGGYRFGMGLPLFGGASPPTTSPVSPSSSGPALRPEPSLAATGPDALASRPPTPPSPASKEPVASTDGGAFLPFAKALMDASAKQGQPAAERPGSGVPDPAAALPVTADIGQNTLAFLEARSELVIERLCNWGMNGAPPLLAMTGDRWWRREKDATEAMIARYTVNDRVLLDGAVLTLLATEMQFDIENQRAFRDAIKDTAKEMPDFVRESWNNEVGDATISAFARAINGSMQEREFLRRIAAMYDRTESLLRSRYPEIGDRLATLLTRHRDSEYMNSRYFAWAREKYPRNIPASAEDLGVIDGDRTISVTFPGSHLEQFFVIRLESPSLVTISRERRPGSFSGYILPRDHEGKADRAYAMINSGDESDAILLGARAPGEYLLRLDVGRTDREPRDVVINVTPSPIFGRTLPQIRSGDAWNGTWMSPQLRSETPAELTIQSREGDAVKVVITLPEFRNTYRMDGLLAGKKLYLSQDWEFMQVDRYQLTLDVIGSLLKGGTPPGASDGPVTCSFRLGSQPADKPAKPQKKPAPKQPARGK